MRRLFTFSRMGALLVFTMGFAGLLTFACSEATDGLVPPGDSGLSGSTDASPSSSPEASDHPSSKSDAASTSTSRVLINEISGSKEWIEIVNAGASNVELGGWTVADRDKATGGPKLSEAVTFPPGTELAANAYGMVLGGGLDAGKACPNGGQTFCIHAEFGISTKSGETIYLLEGDGAVVDSVVYPPDASAPGETWGRIPNADPNGHFEPIPATPGAANTPK